ncbi:MAG: hypothetical protein WA584_23790 [Pyrinomonadaceae bacterium]
MKTLKLTLVNLFLLSTVFHFVVHAQQKDSRFYEAQAISAYKAKDFAAFLENMKLAESLRPNHPRLLYNLAAAYALNGQPKEAVFRLEKLARMKLTYRAAEDDDFALIRETSEFQAVIKMFEANASPLVRSSEALKINEKGLVPESVAFDGKTGAFYLSSVAQRKILVIDRTGAVKVFADETIGLWSVLGIKIDEKRRFLWATVSALEQTPRLQKGEEGAAALFKFDLQTGRLIKKYVLPNQEKTHVLGDLSLASNGDVYATDSASPAIYTIRKEKDEIEVFLEGEPFASLQGLDFTEDRKFLFVADYSRGIFRINLTTKSITNIAPAVDSTLLGIDGLYFYQNSLIAVQNGVNPQRIVRLFLSKDAKSVERVQILEANNSVFDELTLGMLRGNEFYFVANSQWNLLGSGGQLKTPEKLKNAEILKIGL